MLFAQYFAQWDSINLFIFFRVDIEDTNDAQKEMKNKMEKQAIDKGLFDIAKSNAEDILSGILKSATDDYEVKIEWQ